MASTFTANTHLELQGTGDNPGTWGSVLNTNVITIIDQIFGGVQTLSLSSSNVTISTSQSQNNAYILTGTLSANVNIIFPSIGRTIYVVNNTTGAFSVTLKTASAGATIVIAQGTAGFFVLNSTDVLAPSLPDNAAGIAAGVLKAQSEEAGYNVQTGSAYTLVLTDRGKLVAMNNAGANTLTVPPNASVAFPSGPSDPTRIDLVQYGAGQTTIAAGVGVTIRSSGGKLKLNLQYSGATLIQIAANEWVLIGDLA